MMDTEENAQTNLRYRYPGKPREDSSMQFDEDEHGRRMNNRLQENDDEYDVPDEESNVQSNVRSMEKSGERNAAVMS